MRKNRVKIIFKNKVGDSVRVYTEADHLMDVINIYENLRWNIVEWSMCS